MGFMKSGLCVLAFALFSQEAFAANRVQFADGVAQVDCKSMDSIAKRDPNRAAEIVDNTVTVIYKAGETITYALYEVRPGFIYRGAQTVAYCQIVE